VKNNHIAWLLSALAIALAVAVNEVNLSALRDAGHKLRSDETVITNDDHSYLFPFQTLWATGTMYQNDVERYTSTVRSPGYGFLYYVCNSVVGPRYALLALKIFQLLLFGFSVYCLFFIALQVLKKRIWAIAITALYGLLPFTMGFLYYTLTEGVTPGLLITYAFILEGIGNREKGIGNREQGIGNGEKGIGLPAYHNGLRTQDLGLRTLIAALVLALIIVIRPVLGIVGLALPFFLWKAFYVKGKPGRFIGMLVLCGFISMSLMGAWWIRNAYVLGKFTGLHPIYQNEIPGKFRQPYAAVWDLEKGWESHGDRFHERMDVLYEAGVEADTSYAVVDDYVAAMPPEVVAHFGKERLTRAYRQYLRCVFSQAPFLERNRTMPHERPAVEDSAILTFETLSKEYQRGFWLDYFLVTPAKVYKNLAFHSNLSLYMFQHTYRGTWWAEALRWICFIIHSALFLLFPLGLFFKKIDLRFKMLFIVPVLIYVLYLVFVQRGIEERYMLPWLGLMALGLAQNLKSEI
jgi:hypothetical protein